MFRFVSLVVAFAGLVGLIIVLTVNDGQRRDRRLSRAANEGRTPMQMGPAFGGA